MRIPRMLTAALPCGVLTLALTLAQTSLAEVTLFTNAAATTGFGSTEAFRVTGTNLNWELGDDFEAHGQITRIYVAGYNSSFFQVLTPTGVNVRFYAPSAPGSEIPGGLLAQQFVPSTATGFQLGQAGGLDLRLVTPFAADGKYFMSVQMVFANSQAWYWQYDWSNLVLGSPQIWGNPAKVRSQQNGFTWSDPLWVGTNIKVHLRFTLFGEDGTPPDLGSDPCGVWSALPTPDPSPTNHAILRDVAMLSPSDAWAVGDASLLTTPSITNVPIAMHWDGASWTMVSTPIPEPYANGANCGFEAVAAVGPNDVWAAGHQLKQDAAGYIGTHMMVQHWDGSQWSLIPTPMPATAVLQSATGDMIRDIEVIAPNDIWFVGDWVQMSTIGPPQPALAMHWDGSNFTIHPTPYFSNSGHGLEAVSATGPNDVWAVGGAGDGDWANFSYVIHFDGSSWSPIPLGVPGIQQRLFAVEAIAPNDVWVSGQSQIGANIVAWFAHFDGTSFTQVPASGGTLGLLAFGSNDVYACGDGIHHWDGATWSKVSGDLDDAVGATFGAIDGSSPCEMFAVGREVVGSDLLTYSARMVASTWLDHGGAVPGAQGVTAKLSGQGTLLPNEPLVLTLEQAAPFTPGLLFLGTTPLAAPLYGGVFWPVPQVVLPGLVTNGSGGLTLWSDLPANVPSGLSLHLQYWQADGGAPFGVRATNGLSATVP